MSDDVAETLETLLDDGYTPAIKTLLDETRDTSTVEWADVADDMATDAWGTFIEQGLLTHNGDGTYTLDARETITATVDSYEPDEDTTALDDIDVEASSWSTADKLVAGLTFVGFLGYSVDAVRWVIYGGLDLLFGPLHAVLPIYLVILVLAMVTSFWSRLSRSVIIDTSVQEYREKMEELRGDDDSLFGLPDDASADDQEKLMTLQSAMMKSQIRPMVWVMAITIPVLVWIHTSITMVNAHPPITFPLLGELPWAYTVFGPFQTWILWYAVCSISFNQMFDKFFDF